MRVLTDIGERFDEVSGVAGPGYAGEEVEEVSGVTREPHVL